MENYYTVEQVAKLLSMHTKTIQRYIREGKLHANKIGKSWRITGHDLSVFTESSGILEDNTEKQTNDKVIVSSVIDIQVDNFDESTRIINMLTSALNSKPLNCGKSTMYTQYVEYEKKVRVTLWGNLLFVQEILELISMLTKQYNESEDIL